MYFIGIDPGTHDTAIAFLDHNGQLLKAQCLHVDAKIKGVEAVVAMIFKIPMYISSGDVCVFTVENQEISYTAKQGGNPRSMIPLAQVAGAFIGLAARSNAHAAYFPMPQEWKGSTPKHINQKRTFDKLGIPCVTTSGKNPYCHPVDLVPWGLLKGDWEHAADAAGLALWGKEQYDNQQALASFNEKRAL